MSAARACAAALALLLLAACADPASNERRIDDECLAAPFVKTANSIAGMVVPVPGVGLGLGATNIAISALCANQETVAKGESKVADWVIDRFH